MRSTIDSAGRLVIPAEIRRQAGLEPGMSLNIRLENGVVEIEPAPLEVRLERKGRFLVAHPQVEVEALDQAVVEATRNTLRRPESFSEESRDSRASQDRQQS